MNGVKEQIDRQVTSRPLASDAKKRSGLFPVVHVFICARLKSSGNMVRFGPRALWHGARYHVHESCCKKEKQLLLLLT